MPQQRTETPKSEVFGLTLGWVLLPAPVQQVCALLHQSCALSLVFCLVLWPPEALYPSPRHVAWERTNGCSGAPRPPPWKLIDAAQALHLTLQIHFGTNGAALQNVVRPFVNPGPQSFSENRDTK